MLRLIVALSVLLVVANASQYAKEKMDNKEYKVNEYAKEAESVKYGHSENVYSTANVPSYDNVYPQPQEYGHMAQQYGSYGSYVHKLPKCHASIDLTAVPGNCRLFRRCSNGYLSVLSCPDHLVFDNRIRACNWPQNVPAPCGKQSSYSSSSYGSANVYGSTQYGMDGNVYGAVDSYGTASTEYGMADNVYGSSAKYETQKVAQYKKHSAEYEVPKIAAEKVKEYPKMENKAYASTNVKYEKEPEY